VPCIIILILDANQVLYRPNYLISVAAQLFIVEVADIARLHIALVTLVVLAGVVHHVSEEIQLQNSV
jgi:hypothetical protein